MMSKETLARVREATRKHKMLLIAHANALDMQRIALDAGVDVLAHGLWNWGEYDGQPDLPAPIAEAHAQDPREEHRLPGDAARAARHGGHVP
jgi:hypothetical protein